MVGTPRGSAVPTWGQGLDVTHPAVCHRAPHTSPPSSQHAAATLPGTHRPFEGPPGDRGSRGSASSSFCLSTLAASELKTGSPKRLVVMVMVAAAMVVEKIVKVMTVTMAAVMTARAYCRDTCSLSPAAGEGAEARREA